MPSRRAVNNMRLTIKQVYSLLSDTQDKIQAETEFDILSEEYAAVSLAVESLSLAMKSLDRVRARVKVSEILMGAAQ
jgi:hypothetical protein